MLFLISCQKISSTANVIWNGKQAGKSSNALHQNSTLVLDSLQIEEKDTIDGWIKANVVNVRSGPSTNYEVLFQLEEGDKVDLIKEASGWWEIINPRDSIAYIHKDLVSLQEITKPVTLIEAYVSMLRLADMYNEFIIRAEETIPGFAVHVFVKRSAWYSEPVWHRESLAQALFTGWLTLLQKSGRQPHGRLTLFDEFGNSLATVSSKLFGGVKIILH